jgi:tetratricopeptide (TPR) repeat protein
MTTPKKDFFISYNQADRAWAEWIAWQLEANGCTCVIQAWDFQPGTNFVLEMQKATQEAEHTLAVLSRHYLTSDFCKAEWAAAFAKDPTGKRFKLIGVKVHECDLYGLFSAIVHIDLVNQPEAIAIQRLLAGINQEPLTRFVKPPFPGKQRQQIRFPGSLPSVWNVPHLRNPYFTGREDLLSDLRSALTSGSAASLTCPQALHGLGGVGKTQLALEYTYRYAGEYDYIWWLSSEDPAALAGHYAALAVALGLVKPDEQNQPEAIRAAHIWLEHNPGWLLIFDNAETADSLKDYLPHGGQGHTIITSRSPVWGAMAQAFSVEVLPRDKSVQFLLERTGQQDKQAANDLAEELGDLPLALSQAAAYIEETSQSLSGYLDLFRTRRNDLWQAEHHPHDYPDTVGTTWSLSIQRLSALANSLLHVCAFLAPHPIPRWLFTGECSALPSELEAASHDPCTLDLAFRELHNFGLAETTKEALIAHRLAQVVVRERLSPHQQVESISAAIRLVHGSFPVDCQDYRSWPRCAALLPHAIAVTQYKASAESAATETGRLLNLAGTYLESRALYRQARLQFERALPIVEATHGSNHPYYAATLNNLAATLEDEGNLSGAREQLERALSITERTLGPHHPDVANRLNNLALVLKAQGDLAISRKQLERALIITEAALGPSHLDTANRLNNLASVVHSQGDLAGARMKLERALSIYEAILGPDHPTVASTLNNLATVLQDQGDLSGALSYLQRALPITEAALGPNHPNVGNRLNNIATVLNMIGDLSGALSYMQRALHITEAALGPNHPNLANRLNNLGMVLEAQGDLPGARKHLERALVIVEAALGPNHPHVATTQANLATVLQAQGDLVGARRLLEQAVATTEAALGPNHPHVATTQANLATVLQAQGDLVGARRLLEQAVATTEAALGPSHPDVATVLANLAAVLYAQGHITHAHLTFKNAKEVAAKALPSGHPVYVEICALADKCQGIGHGS